MANLNEYLKILDFSNFVELFLAKGKVKTMKKGEYFVRQNDSSIYAGYVESGTLRYTRIDTNGKEHIVCYSFPTEFVCDYPSLISQSPAMVSIQAMDDCIVYIIHRNEITSYWETDMTTQRLGRYIAEAMMNDFYQRLLGFYCDTAEQRYVALLERCPHLPQSISLKEIASFLGVTPETVSHIRRKLLQK